MISVVVPFDDRAAFDAMTGASLARQRAVIELLAIDNTLGAFSSAAHVINAAAASAQGNWLMFAHQDLVLDGDTWLSDAEAWLQTIDNAAMAGVAGARLSSTGQGRDIVSNVSDSSPPQRAGHTASDRAERVQTIDECLFFVRTQLVRDLPFDTVACDGWHLYAVDYSLMLLERGYSAYALPLKLYHRSGGRRIESQWFPRYEDAFYRTLRRVLRKHRRSIPVVYTTCGTWRANRGVLLQKYRPGRMLAADPCEAVERDAVVKALLTNRAHTCGTAVTRRPSPDSTASCGAPLVVAARRSPARGRPAEDVARRQHYGVTWYRSRG